MYQANITLILFLGLLPALLSLWGMRQGQRAGNNRRSGGERAAHRTCPRHPSDGHYVEGVGYRVGDLSCRYNARSPYLRCAVNPDGPCECCLHYASLEYLQDYPSQPKT